MKLPAPLQRITFVRKTVQFFQYMIPCTYITFFTVRGIYSKDGRFLVRGKFRRMFLSFFPSVAKNLQKKHGIQGGCVSCGASCNLLFKCPQWDTTTHLCKIYEDRPNACRFFPITPADIEDRNLVLKGKECGFTFKRK